MNIKLSMEKIFSKLIFNCMLLIFIYGVANVHIYYESLLPFGVALVFAIFYIKYNGYILAYLFGLAYCLSNFTFYSVLTALNVCIVLIISQLLVNKKKLNLNKWKIFILLILSQVVFVITNLGDGKENLALFVSLVIGFIFLYTSMCFFDATILRGFSNKVNTDEKICGGVMFVIFIMGMALTNIGIVNLGMIFSSIILVLISVLYPIGSTIIVSSLIGLSYAIMTSNNMYISLFVMLSLCVIVFKNTYRVLSVSSLLLGYVIFSLIFDWGICWGEFIGLLVGGIVVILIPKKFIIKLKCLIKKDKKYLKLEMLEGAKLQIINKVKELSAIFSEMESVYKDMVRGNLPDDVAKDMLKEELVSSICKGCPNYDLCYRCSGSFLENSLSTFVDVAYDKNKVLLIDLPQYIATHCTRVNDLIECLNNMISSYKEYTKSISNLDTSRVLVADQLNGVCSLLNTLSNDIDFSIKNKEMFSERIIEELSYKGVVCYECNVYENNLHSFTVSLIVNNSYTNDNIIEKVVSKIMRIKSNIVSKKDSDLSNCTVITLQNSPNYMTIYGCAKVNKLNNKISGDTHAIMEIENGKYMASICDGMGSGEKANKISNLTISLIEKFYRAGFENDIILNSINKLLSLSEEENYSTIDLCIIDGKKNYYDFIKLGGCKSFIVRSNGDVEIIDSSGLPVGIIEDIRPHITRKMIASGDIVILVSDGIIDSIGDELLNFLKFNDCINPQSLAEQILSKSLSNSYNISQDDMTVVVLRMVENC